MAAGADDTTVEFTARFAAEEAEAKAKQFAEGVKADLLGVGSVQGEVRLGTAQAEAALGELSAEAEQLRAEVLTPSIVDISTGAAFGELELVTEAAGVLREELAAVGAEAAALPLSAPFLEAIPAVEGFKESVQSILPPLAELPAEVSPALAAIESGLLGATASVESFEIKAARGAKTAARSMTEAKVAIIQLKEQIALLGPESGESVAVLEAKLAQLELRIQAGAQAWGRFRAEARITAIEMKEVAVQSGAAHASLDTLVEGSLSKFPKLEKAVFAAVSAITVLQLAYSETRHVVEAAKIHLGIDIDESIQEGMVKLFEIVTLRAAADQRLAEADETRINLEKRLAASQAELTANGITYTHTVESMTAALAKLEEVHQGTEVIAREFVETILKSEEAVTKERRAIEIGLPVILERGKLTAASSEIIISRLNAEIEAMRRLGESTADIERTRDALEKMQRSIKFEDATLALTKFAGQFSPLGKVTKETADHIVGEAAKIVKAIRELPEEEQKSAAPLLRALESLRTGYERFTTEHAALLKKQEEAARKEADAEAAILKRREDQTRTFLESLRGLLAKPLAGPSIGGGDGAKAIADAKAELAALEKKSGEGFVSGDDLNRIAELKAKVTELGQGLGAVERQAHAASAGLAKVGTGGQEAADKARAALVTLLGKSEEFGAALKAMTVEQRANLQELADGFIADLGGGLVQGEAGIADFVSKFTGQLQASGAVSSQFGLEMAAAFGTGTASLDALFNAAAGGGAGFQGLADGVTIASTGMGEFVVEAQSVVDTTKQVTAATVERAAASQEEVTGYIRAAKAAEGLSKDGLAPLKKDYVDIKNYTKDAAEATVRLVDVNKEAADSAHALTDGLGLLPEQINAVADSLTPVDVGMKLFRENLAAVGPLMGVFERPAQDAAKLADVAPKAGEGVGSIGKAASETAPLLKAMTSELGGDTEAVSKFRTQVQGLRGDLVGLNGVIGQTIKLCSELAKCRAGAAG